METIAAPRKKRRIASRWIRLGSFLIDYTLLSSLNCLMFLVLFASSNDLDWIMSYVLFSFALYFFYYVLMETFLQATLGKKLLGLKIVRLKGREPISFGIAIARTLCRLIPFYYITVLFSEKRQGLHDMIPSTVVIKVK